MSASVTRLYVHVAAVLHCFFGAAVLEIRVESSSLASLFPQKQDLNCGTRMARDILTVCSEVYKYASPASLLIRSIFFESIILTGNCSKNTTLYPPHPQKKVSSVEQGSVSSSCRRPKS